MQTMPPPGDAMQTILHLNQFSEWLSTLGREGPSINYI